ncbi:UNVERIFIED_CONTAM: hypothetical protein FKN15_051516 [Acipenser sinensis]
MRLWLWNPQQRPVTSYSQDVNLCSTDYITACIPYSHYQASKGRPWAEAWRGLVVARRQLWLSQARVPDADKAALLDAPISPGHTFRPAVEEILQCSYREREASQQVAAMLRSHAPVWDRRSAGVRTVLIPTALRGDLRHCLQASTAANTRSR